VKGDGEWAEGRRQYIVTGYEDGWRSSTELSVLVWASSATEARQAARRKLKDRKVIVSTVRYS
jgi:hypothetical protein